MRVLAIDTSTLVASVAVLEAAAGAAGAAGAGAGAARVLAQAEAAVTTHSEGMIGLIDGSLREAGCTLEELTAVAVGAGPGSFTGLRIGMATAKGLCFATGKPLWAVSSLAALALDAGAHGGALVVPVLDARRQEVYAGFYRAGGGRLPASVAPERVLAPAALAAVVAELAGGAAVVLIGNGIAAYRDALAAAGELLADGRATPSAASVGRLAIEAGGVDALATATPAYVRASEAELKWREG